MRRRAARPARSLLTCATTASIRAAPPSRLPDLPGDPVDARLLGERPDRLHGRGQRALVLGRRRPGCRLPRPQRRRQDHDAAGSTRPRPAHGGAVAIEGRRYLELDDPARTVGAMLDGGMLHPGRSGRNHLRVQPARRCCADATSPSDDRVQGDAGGGTRTPTALRPRGPKPRASTSSATPASPRAPRPRTATAARSAARL